MSEKLKKEVEDLILKLTSTKMKRYQRTATNADELIGFIMDDDGKIDNEEIIDLLMEYGLNPQLDCVLLFEDSEDMHNKMHLGRTTEIQIKFITYANKRHQAVQEYVHAYATPTHAEAVDYDVRNAHAEFFISKGQIKKWGKGEYFC